MANSSACCGWGVGIAVPGLELGVFSLAHTYGLSSLSSLLCQSLGLDSIELWPAKVYLVIFHVPVLHGRLSWKCPRGKKRGWRWLVVESSQVVVKLGQFESYWHSYVNLFITFGLFCFLDETYMKGRLQIVKKKLLFQLFLFALKQVGWCYHFHAPATWRWQTSSGNTCRIVCKTIKFLIFPCQK